MPLALTLVLLSESEETSVTVMPSDELISNFAAMMMIEDDRQGRWKETRNTRGGGRRDKLQAD